MIVPHSWLRKHSFEEITKQTLAWRQASEESQAFCFHTSVMIKTCT